MSAGNLLLMEQALVCVQTLKDYFQLSTIVVGKLSDVKSNAKFSEELESDCNQLILNLPRKIKSIGKTFRQTITSYQDNKIRTWNHR